MHHFLLSPAYVSPHLSPLPHVVTPPGYKTTITGDTGETTACPAGTYREEWKPAAAAGSCTACGDNIDSSATEELTSYAITADATPIKVYVRTSASSCCEYTMSTRGWGWGGGKEGTEPSLGVFVYEVATGLLCAR